MKYAITSGIVAGLLWAGTVLSPALAVTLKETEVTCPTNGKIIKAYEYRSYYRSGTRLDLRPIIHGSPSLLLMPVCPDSGFVVYKGEFTNEEIGKIQEIVATEEFKAERAANTDHYIAAYVAERLGADPYILGLRYISASWEAEDDKPQLLNQYLELSLKKFSEFLAGHRTRDDRWWDAELLLANLERRLGRFAEARARLKGLPRDTLVEGSVMERNIDQLRSLVEAGDSKPRRMD